MFADQRLHRIVPAPEREILNAVFLVLQNLFFEGRHVLLAPVVCDASQTQAFDHFRTFRWPTLLGVERDDAPRDEVFSGEVRGWQLLVSSCTVRNTEGTQNDCDDAAARLHGFVFPVATARLDKWLDGSCRSRNEFSDWFPFGQDSQYIPRHVASQSQFADVEQGVHDGGQHVLGPEGIGDGACGCRVRLADDRPMLRPPPANTRGVSSP